MWRFFCRKRRLLPFVCVCMMISSLIMLLPLDDTTLHDEELRHYHPKRPLKLETSQTRHGFNLPNIAFQRNNISVSLKPTLPKQRIDLPVHEVTFDKKQIKPPSDRPIHDVAAHHGNKLQDVNIMVQKEQTKRGVVHQKSGERQPALEQVQNSERKVLLPFVKPEASEAEWKPPPNAGERGQGVVVDPARLSERQRRRMKEGKQRHSFNEFVSNLISVHRSLPDSREPGCLSIQYRSDLPDASVVIIFHNEAWSTLLRTVHSVLDRSPPHLLRQVILVDDFSYLGNLKTPLDMYMSTLKKVKVVRSPSREGLIQARLLGLSHVTASIVVFLDSHCECTEGWLEPLLDRIAGDPTIVTMPVIEAIDDETFEYHHFHAKGINVGTFTWNLLFNWMPIQPSEKRRRKSDIEPIRTPTMAGGLFAIDRNYFYKLGTYDPGMKIWGGENLELSFKVWMCGGTMEIIPCSNVGHVFRKSSPISGGGFSNYLTNNLNRLSAVWLDEYSYYADKARRIRKIYADAGDVSERQELRRRLKCHSFGWYLKNVMPERYFPADETAHGMIEHANSRRCIFATGNQVKLENCRNRRGADARAAFNGYWHMNPGESAVFLEDRNLHTTCLDYSGKGAVAIFGCHGLGGNQLWKYSAGLKQLYHVTSGRCVEAPAGIFESTQLVMSPCNPSNPNQQWLWDTSPLPGPSWRKDMAAGKPVL